MSTPHDDATAFFEALHDAGFFPGRYDHPGDRRLERKSSEGHPDLRIRINFDGEQHPYSIMVSKMDGRQSQVTQWESSLSAHMPSEAVLAMIKKA